MPKPVSEGLQPYWNTVDYSIRLYLGHVFDVLRQLPPKSVHCVVTSPPYWKQRDYQEDNQLGSEGTPEAFVANLVLVFRLLKSVLRDDGVAWLNLGDKYVGEGLVGIPWLTAFALKKEGWFLRRDVVWHKPDPMPESVSNRPVSAHEYIFMLTKQKSDYYFDTEAVRSASATLRSVWKVPKEPTDGCHFATFPRKLIEPCILSSTSEAGCCSKCGAPHERIVERDRQATRPNSGSRIYKLNPDKIRAVAGNRDPERHITKTKTIGWKPGCNCKNATAVPCTVLDPFIGSGTTCCMAIHHGRNGIGIDLNREYLDQARVRIEGTIIQKPTLAAEILPNNKKKIGKGMLDRKKK